MITALTSVCKGYANILLGESDPFWQAALRLLEDQMTPADIRAFGTWWAEHGLYSGEPALKSLLDNIKNARNGVSASKRSEADLAWSECKRWIARSIKPADFQMAYTLSTIQVVGESNLRALGSNNEQELKRRFIEIYETQEQKNGKTE